MLFCRCWRGIANTLSGILSASTWLFLSSFYYFNLAILYYSAFSFWICKYFCFSLSLIFNYICCLKFWKGLFTGWVLLWNEESESSEFSVNRDRLLLFVLLWFLCLVDNNSCKFLDLLRKSTYYCCFFMRDNILSRLMLKAKLFLKISLSFYFDLSLTVTPPVNSFSVGSILTLPCAEPPGTISNYCSSSLLFCT